MSRKPNSSRQTRALLATFLEQSQAWRHGYDLSKETGLKSGTLYPVLMRLSEQGLLESRWQEAERPGLPEHVVDQGGLPVVDVRHDGDVA